MKAIRSFFVRVINFLFIATIIGCLLMVVITGISTALRTSSAKERLQTAEAAYKDACVRLEEAKKAEATAFRELRAAQSELQSLK